MSDVVLMNIGADWRRPGKETVKRGEVFDASYDELARMRRRHQLGTRFMVMAEGRATGRSETVAPEGAAVSPPRPVATQDAVNPTREARVVKARRIPKDPASKSKRAKAVRRKPKGDPS